MLRLLAGLVAAALALAPAIAVPASAQSFLDGEFDPAIPTLEQVAGYEPGQQISRPEVVIGYMRALAEAAPERVRLVEYARSWEGRPLVYAVISSPANMARLDAIQADMQALAQGLSPTEAGALIQRTVPVTWLSYGVHGDEISSSDAALVLAYHLLAAQGNEVVDTVLANSVVIIDPMQNPDGRARFTNSFYAQLGIAPSAFPGSAGNDQPWPGGRFNHYLFDLNRDWFALTQPETRGKVQAVRDWQPVVYVDAHEMGGDETYFFPPGAEPFNPYVTPTQRTRLDLLGRNIGRWMDSIGEPYFTREQFDLFYPGYGDTWPTLNGAVAMTFEQASARGLVWQRDNGELLTYGEGVRNHFTTTLATAETVARNPQMFLRDYAEYRQSARSGSVGSGHFVIDRGTRRWNAEALARRLALQGVQVLAVDGPASACGRTYPQGYLAVSMRQGTSLLVRSLLDSNIALPPDYIAGQEARRAADLPHEMYDTTAWSVGQMSGLDLRECASVAGGAPVPADSAIPARAQAAGPFGLAVPWTDSGQVRLVALALQAGLVGSSTDTAFVAGGHEFGRGTVVFTLADNGGSLDRLVELAQAVGAETVPLASGWTESGPNLGSDSFVRLEAPRVAMLWEDGTVETSAGSTRYVIEQRFGVPVTPIRTGSVARARLGAFSVVVVPDVYTLPATARTALAAYVRNGGVLVTYFDATAEFASGENPLFSTQRETVLGGEPADEEEEGDEAPGTAIEDMDGYRAAIVDSSRRPDALPGALLNTVVDGESFLAAGYDERAPVVFTDGSLVLTPLTLSAGTNVVRYAPAENLVASGHVWAENRRQLAWKPFMIAEENGRGMAVGFASDPTTRGYLDGLDLLLANAVIVAPSRVR